MQCLSKEKKGNRLITWFSSSAFNLISSFALFSTPMAVPLSSPRASTRAARETLAASILEICHSKRQKKIRHSDNYLGGKNHDNRNYATIRAWISLETVFCWPSFYRTTLRPVYRTWLPPHEQVFCKGLVIVDKFTWKEIGLYFHKYLQTFPLCFGFVWPTSDAWKIRPYLGVSRFVFSALFQTKQEKKD